MYAMLFTMRIRCKFFLQREMFQANESIAATPRLLLLHAFVYKSNIRNVSKQSVFFVSILSDFWPRSCAVCSFTASNDVCFQLSFIVGLILCCFSFSIGLHALCESFFAHHAFPSFPDCLECNHKHELCSYLKESGCCLCKYYLWSKNFSCSSCSPLLTECCQFVIFGRPRKIDIFCQGHVKVISFSFKHTESRVWKEVFLVDWFLSLLCAVALHTLSDGGGRSQQVIIEHIARCVFISCVPINVDFSSPFCSFLSLFLKLLFVWCVCWHIFD